MEGTGIESLWGRNIPQPSRPALGHTQPPTQWVSNPFPGSKPTTPSSTEVKERV